MCLPVSYTHLDVYKRQPFHCDFSGKLTMSVLGNHLLNCAGFHAADRGFGIATLNENHYTWVLSRLAVELELSLIHI